MSTLSKPLDHSHSSSNIAAIEPRPISYEIASSLQEEFDFSAKDAVTRRCSFKFFAIDCIEKYLEAEVLVCTGQPVSFSQNEQMMAMKAMYASVWTYFVAAPDSGLIKMGRAKDLKKRLSSLQTGSPVPITLAAAVLFTPDLEGWLHTIFADERERGEWFQATPRIIRAMRIARDKGTRALLAHLVAEYDLNAEKVLVEF